MKVTKQGVVHGHGVVARKNIKQGEIVCTYSASLCESAVEPTDRSKYILGPIKWRNREKGRTEDWYLNAANKNATAGRYINGIRGTRRLANVGFCSGPLVQHPLHGQYYVWVKAIRDIRKGQELLVDYGSEYWNGKHILPVYNFIYNEQEMDKRIVALSKRR